MTDLIEVYAANLHLLLAIPVTLVFAAGAGGFLAVLWMFRTGKGR